VRRVCAQVSDGVSTDGAAPPSDPEHRKHEGGRSWLRFSTTCEPSSTFRLQYCWAGDSED
jgi:hypothetical protein